MISVMCFPFFDRCKGIVLKKDGIPLHIRQDNGILKKPVTGTIVTSNHDLDVPNSLQKKVYDNFQSLKILGEQGKMEEAAKTKQKLIGQIQASRNIDESRFPEISRITNAISAESTPGTKPVARSVYRKKARIKIKVSTDN